MNKLNVIAEVVSDIADMVSNMAAVSRFADYLWEDRTEEERYKLECGLNEMGKLIAKVEKNLALLKGVLPE